MYNIFPHYLINCTIFEKKLLNIKCVFWFSLQILPETSLILRRSERYMIKNVYRSSSNLPFILVRSNETWFYGKAFEKYSNIEFHENPSSGSRVVPCGRTDMTKLTVVFRNVANAPQNDPNNIFLLFLSDTMAPVSSKEEADRLQFWPRIRKGSDLCSKTSYPDWQPSWISSVLPGKSREAP